MRSIPNFFIEAPRPLHHTNNCLGAALDSHPLDDDPLWAPFPAAAVERLQQLREGAAAFVGLVQASLRVNG